MNRIPAPRGRKAAAAGAAPPPFSAAATRAIRRALLEFYDARARSLPWRGGHDSYRVWVSEIMLQQTRVGTVIPYYERWLARFPTLEALADAPLDDVLAAWQGLGYYSRARNLHAAARIVRERHAGRLPEDTGSLRRLPGIGEYTAGAIASIAHGRAAAAIDGNVRRVLARLLDEPAPSAARLRTIVTALVCVRRPGDFNQGLMELGALVCTPRAPRCAGCPLRAHCVAFRRGTQHERPAQKRAAAVPRFEIGTAVVVDAAGRLLLARRPERGLLGGLWQFPGRALPQAEQTAGCTPDPPHQAAPPASILAAAARGAALEAIAQAQGCRTADQPRRLHALPGPLGSIAHAFSHRRDCYHVYAFRWRGAAPRAEDRPANRAADGATAAWHDPDSLAALPIPAAQRRILALLEGA